MAPLSASLTVEIHAGQAYRAALDAPLRIRGTYDHAACRSVARPAARVVSRSGAGGVTGERRRVATDAEVAAALRDLDAKPRRVAASDWPADLPAVDQPGLYSWWIDDEGASTLSRGIGLQVAPGQIYAGLTGATRWPSGTRVKATLRVADRQQPPSRPDPRLDVPAHARLSSQPHGGMPPPVFTWRRWRVHARRACSVTRRWHDRQRDCKFVQTFAPGLVGGRWSR